MASPVAGADILAADYNTVFPEGSIIPFAGKAVPTDYLECDGSAVSRTTYSGLFAALCPSGTFTVTIASPGVFSKVAHGLVVGDRIHFKTTGALPTGLATNTDYYVISAGLTADAFEVALTPGGAAINTSGSQSGTHTLYFSNWGRGDGSTTFNLPDFRSKTLIGKGQGTMTLTVEAANVSAASDTFTIPNLTFPAQGQAVVLTSSGTLPAGLSLATTYYIIRASSTTIKFAASFNDAAGGTVFINITDAGTGIHTLTFTPVNRTLLAEQGGEETHGLSITELASHRHDVSNAGNTSGGLYPFTDGSSLSTQQTGFTGGSVQHNIMQPFAVIRWIIRAKTYA